MSKSEIEKRIDAAWNEAFDHGEQQGADRERRRIRRALNRAVRNLRALADDDGEGYRDIANWCIADIDAATRAKKGKRK